MKVSGLSTLLLWLVMLPAAVLPANEVVEDCTVRFQDNGVCVCSMENSDGPVKCSNESLLISIEPCYCAYYDQHLNKTIVGHCFYTCYRQHDLTIKVTDSSVFNDDLCLSEKRTGFFCYGCKEPFALGAYSNIAIDCVPCDYHGYKNWLKTFSIALLPVTLLYILAVLLSIDITSSRVAGLVLVLQCITSSPVRTYETIFTSPKQYYYGASMFVKIFFSLLRMINLDFFRLLYSPVCLHPKLTVFELACLYYIVALYPFLLIFITYLLITAYDRQFRILVWLWKPFKACIARYRITWNIRTSLLKIFASFVLISSVEVMDTSLRNMLVFTQTYDPFGNKIKKVVIFSDNVTYFSLPHLPFAVLAIFIFTIFVLIPLFLLVVYPCRCFQRRLNALGLKLQMLHFLMDIFQGSYKLYPRDMRYFSAFYLFLRVLMLLHAELLLSKSTLYTSGIISFVASGIIAVFQPYKNSAHNLIDTILLLLMGIYFISAHEARLAATAGYSWLPSSIIQSVSITLIVLYCILLLAWKLVPKKVQIVITKVTGRQNIEDNIGRSRIIESFVCNREEPGKKECEVTSSTPLLREQTLTATY